MRERERAVADVFVLTRFASLLADRSHHSQPTKMPQTLSGDLLRERVNQLLQFSGAYPSVDPGSATIPHDARPSTKNQLRPYQLTRPVLLPRRPEAGRACRREEVREVPVGRDHPGCVAPTLLVALAL